MKQPCNCDQAKRLLDLLRKMSSMLDLISMCTNSVPPLASDARDAIDKELRIAKGEVE